MGHAAALSSSLAVIGSSVCGVPSPSRRYSVLGSVLELQDSDQWTSPPSFFLAADARARRYSQKQRRFAGRSPGGRAGSGSASEGNGAMRRRNVARRSETNIQKSVN